MKLTRKQAQAAGIELPRPQRKKLTLPGSGKGRSKDNDQGRDSAFDAMCQQHGLPVPVHEFQFCPGRKFRFDYVFEGWLAVEIEGGVFTHGAHGSISGIKRDIEKYNLAALHGYTVLRFLPEQIASGAAFPFIKAVLEGGAADG